MFNKARKVASARHVDAYLVSAVLAIEMIARGVVHRQVERLIARLWLTIRREKRLEEMSLGVCQVQVRHLGTDIPVRSRVQILLRADGCIDACAQVLLRACADNELSAENASGWTRRDWRELGHAYNGTFDYGDVLQHAYRCLLRRNDLTM